MKRAQGGTRSLPDGLLHIQNFTVTTAIIYAWWSTRI